MHSRRFRTALTGGILTVLYLIAGKLSLKLAFLHASASPVWPPAGIALAALLVLGYRVWPAIFIGAFLVNLTTAGNVPTSLGIATGNTLEAVAGALNSRPRKALGWKTPAEALDQLLISAQHAPVAMIS